MDFATIDDTTLLSWYGQAIQAMNDLMTGGKVTSVSYSQGTGARSVTYTQANIADLRQWIAQLAAALSARSLILQPARRRAIGVRF